MFAQIFPPPQQLECFHRKQLKNHSNETNREWEWIDKTGHEWNSYPMWTQREFNCTISTKKQEDVSFLFCFSDTIVWISLNPTSCSRRRRVSLSSMSSRAFNKLSDSPWLTLPACSNCSRSRELTWLRLADLRIVWKHWETTWHLSHDQGCYS